MATPVPPAPDTRCVICLTPLGPADAKTSCPSCRTPYHAECWAENRGCAVYGCPKVPPTEGRGAVEIPPAYWGQEDKPCPACGATILAAAVRCRHCGATFESSRPQGAREFQERRALAQRLPELRRKTILLFIFCLLPCAAPVTAVAGAIWYQSQRDSISALPALYAGLARLGLAVAAGQTVAIFVAVILYALLRTG